LKNRNHLQYIKQNTLPFHFCPGCGHGLILDHLNSALVELELDHHQVVIVTDIGCSGLSDKYFTTNAFHGLHGRSVTYATGIKLANPALNVIVIMGDGGCGIGGHHLVSAARRNVGVTVLVFNNLNYGMTGGQHSVTTPLGAVTSSTSTGNIEYPMNVCATVAVNGASFVARSTAFDEKLTGLIVKAIKNPGFSLVDIWDLCTAYYVSHNKFSKRELESTLDTLNFKRGIIQQEERKEYSVAYREGISEQEESPLFERHPIKSIYKSGITQRIECMIAGDAGMRIGTAAAAFSRGAIISGLWATQRNDYPVTVRTGYSISEVILSPEAIIFPGVSSPNLMIVLFQAGFEKVKSKISDLSEEDLLVINVELLPVKTSAKIISMDFRKTRLKQEYWALLAIAELLRHLEIYPLEALKEAIGSKTLFNQRALNAIDSSNKIIVDFPGMGAK
jgi:pyruvate/2-oxoacid:ferredoxin oxidoreductase beta subunit